MAATPNHMHCDLDDANPRCLQSAFEDFSSGLKRRQQGRWAAFKVDGLDIAALEVRLNSILDRRPTSPSGLKKFGRHIIDQLVRYAPGVDQLMQGQGPIASGVWGCIRMAINVVEEYQTIPELAVKDIRRVFETLIRLKSHVGSFTDEEEKALTSVYTRMLWLMHVADIILEDRRIRRLQRSILRKGTLKLEARREDLQEAVDEFDRVSGSAQIRVVSVGVQRLGVWTQEHDRRASEMQLAHSRERAMDDIMDKLKERTAPPFPVPEPTEGTCQWIFNEPAYERWAKEDHHSLLWVSAPPVTKQFKRLHSSTKFFTYAGYCNSDMFGSGDETETPHTIIGNLETLASTEKGRAIVFCRPLPIFQKFMAPDRSQYNYHCLQEEHFSRASKEIHTRAAGSFLWARMYLIHLSKAPSQRTLKERLGSFPATLSQAYDKMISANQEHLDKDQVEQRDSILLAVLTARCPLTVGQLSESHDLPRHQGADTAVNLCLPLLEVRDNRIIFTHSSAREHLLSPPPSRKSLRLSLDESNLSQALKCLNWLLQVEYGSPERIKSLVRSNNDLGEADSTMAVVRLSGGCFLDYAARYWFLHVVALPKPPRDLVELVGNFLGARQFVFWGEYVTERGNSKELILVAEREIRKWLRRLPADLGDAIKLEDYVMKPYEEMSEVFSETDGDKLFEWLILMALGDYFYEKGDKRAFALRKQVAAGLVELRGREDRLSLRAQSQEAAVYLWQGEMRGARDRFVELSKIQQRVLGEDKPDMWESLAHTGRAEYYMNDYDNAFATYTRAAGGLRRTLGEKSAFYLGTLVYKAQVLVMQRKVQEGASQLQSVYDEREAEFGPEDGFSIYVQGFLGEAYRKEGKSTLALQHLEENYQYRQNQSSSSNDYLVVDAAISLLIAYRDFGMHDKASSLAQEVGNDVAALFERRCQLVHLNGLLGVDRGHVRESIKMLREFVVQTRREDYNRGFLWLLLDLATLLRRDERHNEASSLFDNLVVVKEASTHASAAGADELDDEPSPPKLLELAERALTLIKNAKPVLANELLEGNNLVWVRERDTWYWEAASPADTATMKGPRWT
ncbi:hypothetical protein QBC33DRAFT_516753 [Phialemonium atrogriseum]|uniref:Uncharacterized protein n=1 Tax=Phialemonium atrogriseum TaxID=1093897 RepID=A0AAJ0BW84_9PEZI|nr:uncharacterized protein QBC33DRAFT_516753 [Phialemonium atrogriseum]KAK1765430.1 hypothetical protein QBC33DRAFT_516753 [Phialemonium atrogriseum]